MLTALILTGCTNKQPILTTPTDNTINASATDSSFTVPAYNGQAYIIVNDNKPYFNELIADTREEYSKLDSLGRCGTAYACICKELMPTEERGKIGNIKPTGWKQAKYPEQVGENPGYLYNRCHLIAYCLAGENDNEKNLITGTRYLNVKGMLPFEEKVAKYIDKNPNNHVMYRVTPVFEGNNLLATGVLMEAASVEDDTIRFCVFCFNVQPGIEIDYATGDNRLTKETKNMNVSLSTQPIEKTQVAETTNIQLPVANIYQNPELPQGCEITSLAIVLNYHGYNADKCDLSDNYLPKWSDLSGDPEYYYLREPRSDGYYCFAGALMSTINNYNADMGTNVSYKNLSGSSAEALYSEIDNNNPVIVWGTLKWQNPYVLNGLYQNLHCMVLSGYTNDTVTITDPIYGVTTISKATFESIWNKMGSRALVVM